MENMVKRIQRNRANGRTKLFFLQDPDESGDDDLSHLHKQ
jgi:hypothetical protein